MGSIFKLLNKTKDEIDKRGGFLNFTRLFCKIYKGNGSKAIISLAQKKLAEFRDQGGQLKYSNADVYFQNYLNELENSICSNLPPEEGIVTFPKGRNPSVKLIAFYLPQFHPFPENDEWWGKGFTEWANVTKAIPQFLGHYQPKLPADLGFYDLRLPEVQIQQAELAVKYGIYGFCYYYYWFGGKLLMERPLHQMLQNKEIDMPFCICWANENWTRCWDGKDQEILIAQKYSQEDDLAFIQNIEQILRDPRYIRIEGKPILLIYSVLDLPDAKQTVSTWRNYCRQSGLGDIYLVAVQRFKGFNAMHMGFDAMVEFPPHAAEWVSVKAEQSFLNPAYQGGVWDYCEFVKQTQNRLAKEDSKIPIFHGVMPSWDNTARRPDGKGNVFANSSPKEYYKWLKTVCEHTYNKHSPEERLVFINAWNEWAEGAYLEPDRKYGYANLKASAQALEYIECQKKAKDYEKNFMAKVGQSNQVAVILHLYYCDLWNQIRKYLENLAEPFDLYVSLPEIFDCDVITEILIEYPNANIRGVINRGRDIAPFLSMLKEISKLNYTCVCKIHSKKSQHLRQGKSWHHQDGDKWRDQLFDALLGSQALTREVISRFRNNPKLGVLGPKNNMMQSGKSLGSNAKAVTDLQVKLGLNEMDDISFFAGSMFWFRPEALTLLTRLGLSTDDFPEEAGQIDGTLAHAIERMFCQMCEASGYKVEYKATND